MTPPTLLTDDELVKRAVAYAEIVCAVNTQSEKSVLRRADEWALIGVQQEPALLARLREAESVIQQVFTCPDPGKCPSCRKAAEAYFARVAGEGSSACL